MTVLAETDYVLNKLRWMQVERIWPNGLRYLWTRIGVEHCHVAGFERALHRGSRAAMACLR
jgi:hypothetical protein